MTGHFPVAALASFLLIAPAGEATPQSVPSEAAREKWQRVPDLLRAMDVRVGSVVADVGAGSGFLTVRLAQAVGAQGRVYSVDIVPDVLKRLRERVSQAQLSNVEVIEATETDPRLPENTVDSIVMVNAYHEVTDNAAVLKAFHTALKPGGRLVMCEPRPKAPGQTRAEQVKSHVLSPELITQELSTAGFQIVGRDDKFTANPSGGENAPYSLVVATKQ